MKRMQSKRAKSPPSPRTQRIDSSPLRAPRTRRRGNAPRFVAAMRDDLLRGNLSAIRHR